MKELKRKHVEDAGKADAEMIFSTVHRAKGMEYDAVQLVEDFVTEAKLEKLKADAESAKEPLNLTKWNEEINLLYVAITRTKGLLRIPEILLPKDWPSSPHIQVIKAKKEEEKKKAGQKYKGSRYAKKEEQPKEYTKLRLAHKNNTMRWTPERDAELRELYEREADLETMVTYFGCTKGLVLARLKKLGCWQVE
jgi:superfamily I DNA/RNA helicase